MKFRRTDDGGAAYFCKGCDRMHHVDTKWDINFDTNTISPSVLVKYRHPKGYSNDNPAPLGYDGEYVEDVCHSFVRDGNIEYLTDCTHNLAGQTVELEDV